MPILSFVIHNEQSWGMMTKTEGRHDHICTDLGKG